MPKVKTHTGAKKRFKLSSTGKIRRKHAYTSHCLGDAKKSKKQKRFLGQTVNVHAADISNIRRLLHS